MDKNHQPQFSKAWSEFGAVMFQLCSYSLWPVSAWSLSWACWPWWPSSWSWGTRNSRSGRKWKKMKRAQKLIKKYKLLYSSFDTKIYDEFRYHWVNPICPQLSFGLTGLFMQPLVSMLTHIKTKGIINDLMGQKDQQNRENPMTYGIFLLADKFVPKILVQIFQT